MFLLSASLPDTHRHCCIGNFTLLLTSAPLLLLLLLLQMWPLLPLQSLLCRYQAEQRLTVNMCSAEGA
jgi:hypothetical protein